MLPLGKNLQPHLTIMQNSAIAGLEGLPANLLKSFLPYALISVPLMLVSITAPLLMSIVLVLTLLVLFGFSNKYETSLFEVKQPQTHLLYIMPYCGFSSLWGIGVLLGNRADVLPVVALYLVVLGLVIAPTYIKNIRFISLNFIFKFFGSLSVLVLFWSYFQ